MNWKRFIAGIAGIAFAIPFAHSASAADVTLKLAHVQPETHAFHKGALAFAESLKSVSGGKMDVEIFSNGVMGNERDLLEAVQIGTIDAISVTSALTGTFNDGYQVFSLPFLFKSYQHAFAAMDNPEIRAVLEPKLVAKGIRPIAYWIGGARSYYGLGAVEKIGDLQGKKLRTMEAPYYVRAWKELGAIPTPLPFGEVYMALQTKMVDGAEGAINTYVSKKFYEVAPHVAVINYVYSVQLLHLSEMTWKKLSDEQRGWVSEAAAASAEAERQVVLDEDAAMAKTLASHNVKVTQPELGQFQAKVTPVYEMFRKDRGEEAYKLVQKIQKIQVDG